MAHAGHVFSHLVYLRLHSHSFWQVDSRQINRCVPRRLSRSLNATSPHLPQRGGADQSCGDGYLPVEPLASTSLYTCVKYTSSASRQSCSSVLSSCDGSSLEDSRV